MANIGIDFGTGNTVIAVYNQTLGRAETLGIPGITAEWRYRLAPNAPEQVVHVIPSMIHYSATETLIGNQVLARGLAEHGDTLRFMKRNIGQGNTKRKKTAQGMKSAQDAGKEFLTLLINYASARLDLANDEFTFTIPTEAFEHYQDWLRTLTEELGIRRLRLVDEPTACVLGYHGAARRDEHFAVFDFGCGTLDVSVVKLDLAAADDRKAQQLGQAGRDLGGMNLDQWVADDFCARNGVDSSMRQELEALILRQAEEAKIALSDPAATDVEMTVLSQSSRAVRAFRTTYRHACPECERGRVAVWPEAEESCLGCLLLKHDFLKHTRETLDRALENASVKVGLRRGEIVKVLVTGGTSLVPCVGKMLHEYFDGRVEYQSPFDAVARGACRGVVAPILQHDYAIEGFNKEKQAYDFTPLFKIGAEYPTDREVRLWARGTYDSQVRVGLKIYEVSRMKRSGLGESLVDESGALRAASRVTTDFSHACLNADTPTFIVAEPPVSLARDKERFLCAFKVDGQRRLLVTVTDSQTGKPAFTTDEKGSRRELKEYPVVRL